MQNSVVKNSLSEKCNEILIITPCMQMNIIKIYHPSIHQQSTTLWYIKRAELRAAQAPVPAHSSNIFNWNTLPRNIGSI